MTLRQLQEEGTRRLTLGGIEFPQNDAAALLEHCTGLSPQHLLLERDKEASPKQAEAFFAAISQRLEKRPLQYILGCWDFMGLSLQVGEGVLIPRDDTEVLVRSAAEILKNFPSSVGLDLCAGSGAVSLGLCSLLPRAVLTALELSPTAFTFLQENCKAFPLFQVSPLQGDVLSPETASQLTISGGLDFILSNPPYIPREELGSLQDEVQKEPALALDGGEDGLCFYRAIAQYWLPLLRSGGLIALEIGEEQGAQVCRLLAQRGCTGLQIHKDLTGLDRAITGFYHGTQPSMV